MKNMVRRELISYAMDSAMTLSGYKEIERMPGYKKFAKDVSQNRIHIEKTPKEENLKTIQSETTSSMSPIRLY